MSRRRRGRVGRGPRGLIAAWRIRQALIGAVVAITLIGAAQEVVAPVVAVVVLAPCAIGWQVAARRVARAASGLVGEREVARVLRGFGEVIYGWTPPGAIADVDVVVVSPCQAAIEVKHASGRVRTRVDGTVYVGGRRLPGRPLGQAVRGAAAVREALGRSELVDAVLCVTGMVQRPRVATTNGVPVVVCSPRHLRRVLRRLPRGDPASAGALLAEP